MALPSVGTSILKATLATVAYAALHSALATEAAKSAAERAVGTRLRNALCRPMFNAVAVVTTTGLLAYVWRLPDRPLWRVRGPAAGVMRVGQLASLGLLGWAALSQDTLGFTGLPSLWALVTGRRTIPREPAGQGPALDERTGQIRAVGPFARLRQPANVAFVPMLWLNPTMTAKWAAFAAVVTGYSVVGSLHAERLLRDAYGSAYARYQARVPLFVPGLRPAPFSDGPEGRARSAG